MWNDAKAYCESKGGHLATITSQKENDLVQHVARQNLIWLGGTDEGHEGLWTWVTEEPWSFQAWEIDPMEPNGGTNENHLMMGDYSPCWRVVGDIAINMGYQWNNSGQWNDANGNTELAFVCEWEGSETSSLYSLAVNKTGSGIVTSNPARINCEKTSQTCSAKFPLGATVTLNASGYLQPIWVGRFINYVFIGWNGACSGIEPSCTVTMDTAKTVTANFKSQPENTDLLVVYKSGDGSVTSDPAGIHCGTDCAEIYNNGTTVTLTAMPGMLSTFSGWGGVCTGIGNCKVVATDIDWLTTPQVVNATFRQVVFPDLVITSVTGPSGAFGLPIAITTRPVATKAADP